MRQGTARRSDFLLEVNFPLLTCSSCLLRMLTPCSEGAWKAVQAGKLIATCRSMARRNRSNKQCVLVIDDEAAVLESIKDVLACYGFTVYTASSGKEDIAVFRHNQHDIDMVLLDFLLPDMSGEWIFENLRSLDPDVRVVLLTGCEESVAERMLKRGLRGYLQKPFSMPDLVESVQDAINSPVLA